MAKQMDATVKKVDKVEKISAGEAYHIAKKEKESKSYGGGRSPQGKASDRKKKHKDRMAMMRSMTDRIRAGRSKMNESLPKFGGK